MFVYPVAENEVESVTSSLNGNSSAGFDEIPEFLVKQCVRYLKKPLKSIFIMPPFNLEFFHTR